MKILIVRFGAIGDIILATPLIRSLRKKFNNARIDFVLKKEHSPLLKFNPNINNLIEFDKKKGIKELFKLIKFVKTEKYDFIVDIQKNVRSILIDVFSGTKTYYHKKETFKRFFLVEFGMNLYRKIIPISERYFSAVKSLGIESDGMGLEIFIEDKTEKEINKKFPNSKGYISIAPYAFWSTKRWGRENFISIGEKLSKKYNMDLITIENDYSLLETSAIIKKSKILLTNDTGAMHIAVAFKTPVVAIFGPTVKEFGFYPYTDERLYRVISRDMPCKPCTTKGGNDCFVKNFKCMTEIKIDDVYRNACELLEDG